MRSEYSVKNSITSIISNLVAIAIGFISQALFIRILGAEYLGLNGLFTNILTVLSFFELGIGNAIIFHLYRPISEKNTKKIKSLIRFYKRAYSIIALFVFFCGLIIMPFLPIIVGEISIDINIYIVYAMFLASTVSSYLLMYKRNLIYANQKNYIINIIHILYLILMNAFQIIILYISKNYYLYLGVKIIFQILENIVNSIIANKLYPYIKEKNVEKLDLETKNDIFSKVKALVFHKIGTVVVTGTDNVLISSFFGVKMVGIYSNYALVINAIITLFGQIITSTTASVGNLLTSDNEKESFLVFEKVRFLNFILASIGSIGILVAIKPFISLWVGKKYILDDLVLLVLVINCFQNIMKNTFNTFKDSGGIWVEDKYIPIIESAANLILSIIFLKLFGLAGVFLGTIVSSLILWLYSYPKYVYKKLFKRQYTDYLKEFFEYLILFIITATITYAFSKVLSIENNCLLDFIIKGMIAIAIPSIIFVIVFRKTENFKYYLNLIRKTFQK